jgi:hypothetical protein
MDEGGEVGRRVRVECLKDEEDEEDEEGEEDENERWWGLCP